MRRGCFLALAFLMVCLSGCKKKNQATYLVEGGDAIALVHSDGVLAVIDMPRQIVESYGAYHGITALEAAHTLFPIEEYRLCDADLRQIRLLLSAIGRETGMEDGWTGLSGIRKEAGKSGFPRTWESLTGAPGLWKEMCKAGKWIYFDLAQALPEKIDWDKTDSWLDAWLNGALHAGQRRE